MFVDKLIFGVTRRNLKLTLSQSDGWTLKMSLTGRIYFETKVCSKQTQRTRTTVHRREEPSVWLSAREVPQKNKNLLLKQFLCNGDEATALLANQYITQVIIWVHD